jgi:hypothetical protein
MAAMQTLKGYLAHDLARRQNWLKLDECDLRVGDLIYVQWEEAIRILGRWEFSLGHRREVMAVEDVYKSGEAWVRRGRMGTTAHALSEGLTVSIYRHNPSLAA